MFLLFSRFLFGVLQLKMFIELLVIGIALIAFVFYKLSTNHSRYYEERNIKYKGVAQSIKNMYSIFSGKYDVFQIAQNMYSLFPDEP